MLNKKNGLLALGGLALAAGVLASCSTTPADLTIWCPSSDQATMMQIISDFKAANEEYAEKNIVIRGNFAEGETQAELTKDKAVAADVICMVDDNIRASVDGNALLALDDEKDAITASDGADAVEACSIDGHLYGYPYRADNGFMLIYDSNVISDEQAKSVEGILDACEDASEESGVNVKFHYNIAEGWYGVSYFNAFGLKQTVKNVDGENLISSDYYSSKGAEIAESVMTLAKAHPLTWEMSIETATVEKGFEDGSVAACIMWNDYNNILAKCPTAKVTTLPTITVNGVTEQLVTFMGYKAMVINNHVEHSSRPEGTVDLAKDFARFATNEANQEKRIDLGYGPSNTAAAASVDSAELPFVGALAKQVADGAYMPQASTTTSNFWTPLQTFGGYIKARSWGTVGSARAALSALVGSTGWENLEYINNGSVADPAA